MSQHLHAASGADADLTLHLARELQPELVAAQAAAPRDESRLEASASVRGAQLERAALTGGEGERAGAVQRRHHPAGGSLGTDGDEQLAPAAAGLQHRVGADRHPPLGRRRCRHQRPAS